MSICFRPWGRVGARVTGKREYEDIQVGESATASRTITEADVNAFAEYSGDYNPIHVDEEFAQRTRWGGRIAHGMLVAGLVTRTLSELGGEGAVHTSQEVSFRAPVRIGDIVTVTTEVVGKVDEKRRLLVASTWTNQDGVVVVTGEGELLLPR
jgi:3-hydroxybutyryl-CoA dehydratase